MMPIFSYGTLQPGQTYWPQIASLIHQTQLAKIEGFSLWHFEHLGYPAIMPEDDMSVSGTLLFAQPSQQHTLLQIMDDIEGISKQLYTREQTLATTNLGQTLLSHVYVYHKTRWANLPKQAIQIKGGCWLDR